MTGSQQDVGSKTVLAAQCGLGTSCDYSHTAAVSLQLPSNVTYTSDSGVFLTQQPSPVPEPGALSLFGAGLTGLAALWRRRKH